ncbi:MAG: aspartate dehydrogenase, partial [Rhodospirillales bacterium]|nr:aspartate dehydrogenase [Rhodospirillales bacterium]
VIECAPSAVFAEVAEPAIRAGRIFIPLSVGALLGRADLIEAARLSGARIVVPSGGLMGLDAVRACAESSIQSVKIVTRKPPAGLADAPLVRDKGIDLKSLTAPLKIFEGSIRQAAIGFPANINVGAALSLAGIGPDRTMSEIWADPGVERNTHRITVEADAARFEMTIENVPTLENPRTSRLTALSIVATLRGLTSYLKIGT